MTVIVLKRLFVGVRCGFRLTGLPTIEQLVEDDDKTLLQCALNNRHHVLHCLLFNERSEFRLVTLLAPTEAFS